MSSLHSAHHMINLIVKQSKDKINENKIVNSMLAPYSVSNMLNTKTDLMLQAGISNQKSGNRFFKKQINLEIRPNSNIKDSYSFFSVRKQTKQNTEVSLHIQNNTRKALNNYFKRSNRKSDFSISDKKQSNRSQKSQKIISKQFQQSSFVKIKQQTQKLSGFLQREQIYIGNLRQLKNIQLQQQQTEKQKQQTESKKDTQRQNRLTSYLQNHVSRQNNSHTYDIQGDLLFLSHENNLKAISKVYPPTIKYEVQNQEDIGHLKHRNNRGIKNRQNYSYSQFPTKEKFIDSRMRGTKGQIFKSSVLKTINLSKISIGATNGVQGQMQFMKRNDLFNNNHCRQTTSIPFMRVQDGAVFKEKPTNQCISNKDCLTQTQSREGNQSHKTQYKPRAKSHQSKARSELKRYSIKMQPRTCSNSLIQSDKEHPDSKMDFNINNSIGDSRYSSFYFKRPHTTQVGRIKRQNQNLFHSMLVEDS